MKAKVPVAVLGATGTVGQKFVRLLADHPWFEITALAASDQSAGRPVLAVRATANGRVTAVIHDPRPGTHCSGNVAASGHEAFFMTCVQGRSTGTSLIRRGGRTIRKPHRFVVTATLVYRFQVTNSGQVTGLSLIKGGVLNGVWSGNIAAAPDGSEVAVEALRPLPSGQLFTNTVPEGIFVISTRTGSRALWRTGPYVPGAVQFANGSDLSFTRDGHELVVLEARCHRSRYLSNCNGNADVQVRAFSPAARGGSLEGGRVLVRPSQLRPPGTRLSDAFISPDGSAVTAVLATCPRHGPCMLRVARISVATGRVLQVLYEVRTETSGGGFFERFFSSDPSGRYLILDAGAGSARVNGWIDHGRLVPLFPANGNDASYEAW